MKKFYTLLMVAFITLATNAQCTIDASLLSPTEADIFPSARHLPHLVVDSAYDQTIQLRIPHEISQNFLGFVQADLRIDSVRLDTIEGLPTGITWNKNPDVLYGGEAGCGQFTGVTSDAPDTFQLNFIGMVWAHLSVPLLGVDVDTFMYGTINRFPPFANYFVVVEAARAPLSLITDANNLCFGDTAGNAEVFANGGSPVDPYVYAWSSGEQTYLADALSAGTYTVTVTSGTETATASVTISQQQTPITLVATTNAGSNGNDGEAYVVASGGLPPYDYQWNRGAGTTDTVTGLAPGNYRVTVTDALGCSEVENVTVQDLSTGIANLFNSAAIMNVFPNPANTQLNISIDAKSQLNARVDVIDITGRILYSAPVSASGRYNFAINTSSYSAGIYTLQLSGENQSARQRFVVSH